MSTALAAVMMFETWWIIPCRRISRKFVSTEAAAKNRFLVFLGGGAADVENGKNRG
jgi:hypothetical protein